MKRVLFAAIALAVACRAPIGPAPSAPGEPPPAPPPPPPTAESQFQDVGTLGAWTVGRGLNDEGLVVGSGSASQYGMYPVISRGGAIHRLEMFPGVSDNRMTGMADAIDENGRVAGLIGTDGVWYVTLWDSTGRRESMTAITRQGWGDVVDMNDNADVLAWWEVQPEKRQSVFVRGGVVHSIGHLSTISWTEPVALNNRGQVVGRSAWFFAQRDPAEDPDLPRDTVGNWVFHHPILWQDGALRDLGVFGKATACSRKAPCASGIALAINDRGDVVGFSEDNDFIRRPFLWRDGVLLDLGVFPGKHAVARAINSQGQIAGDGEGGAFLWENGASRQLGQLGGGYMEVTAMNSRGEVAGTGLTAAGEQHAFVWSGGQLIDLGMGLPGACAAKAVSVNERGDVLIAVAMQCFRNLDDPRLTNFTYVRPQRAVLWKHP